MSRLSAINPQNAAGETAGLFAAAEKKMGAVPNVLRVLGNSPMALNAYLTLSEILGSSSFDAREREALALTVAGANGCDYCASAHAFISKNLKVSDDEIHKRLRGESEDVRLAAALAFARAIVDKKGWVDESDLNVARSAGLGDREIVEIVTIVVANMLTNYVNHVARTEIDFPVIQA